ncbi:hypothetical protein [Paraflavitalea sp. CAU 1676]|uniref:hypothetical protein n=1 Tax=Paraflavitalea sp. CAU 1676 TaxID=3032598 RepID=UPI0023DB34AF|nr:hypothetical protein [Paraflavitalea sp. CAU 1676]MDF2188956.1 hypothetical protein [Paraflavitalea sp. CAU 1676]
MTALNFLKHFKSKRYTSEMLNNIEHVLTYCENTLQHKTYMTASDEYDQRLLWAFGQALHFYGCNFQIGKLTQANAAYERWVSTVGVPEVVVINEIAARMLSYLHNSVYDIRYYRKLIGEFTYYRYIKELKEKH